MTPDLRASNERSSAPLSVSIEDGQLVIRVGINTIAFVAETFNDWNERLCVYEARYKVADPVKLAHDVVLALEKVQEGGTTPLHLLLDNAIETAADNGSLGFEERP